jgi:hypothetical protein
MNKLAVIFAAFLSPIFIYFFEDLKKHKATKKPQF